MDWSPETMFSELRPGGELSAFASLTLGAEELYQGGPEGFEVDYLHPMLLAAKVAMNKEDYPSWWAAMKGPNADDW